MRLESEKARSINLTESKMNHKVPERLLHVSSPCGDKSFLATLLSVLLIEKAAIVPFQNTLRIGLLTLQRRMRAGFGPM